MLSTLTNKKIVMGVCIPRSLKKVIDERRGYIPRSTFISLILEQHIQKRQNENEDYVVEKQQSKSKGQPGHRSTNPSDLPFTDS